MIRFIYLFLIYSFMGYLWEVLLYILKDKGFINRGELRGPWIFVYGLGGVIISYIISNYDDFFIVFIMSILLCGVLEYTVSLIEEIVFKRRWWDYSHMFMNINGITNNSIFWGAYNNRIISKKINIGNAIRPIVRITVYIST